MSIAATRMHRSLTDFVSPTDMFAILLISPRVLTVDENPLVISIVSQLQWNETPCDRIKVTVDTPSEQYQMP